MQPPHGLDVEAASMADGVPGGDQRLLQRCVGLLHRQHQRRLRVVHNLVGVERARRSFRY